ncbi:MAG: type II/IV secretion system protein, partial [Elusimicrobia bacterium]|nr:type II/IV secretion system protein [Elusimicrobiota bacterium]
RIVEGIRDEGAAGEGEEDVNQLRDMAFEAPVVRLVNLLVENAVTAEASDIHIEPFEDALRVRYRIDGILFDQESPPRRLQAAVTSRIKIMAELNIAERRLPQDGRFRVTAGKRTVTDLRMSTMPAMYGEKVVLRILGKGELQSDVTKLGFEPEHALPAVQLALKTPSGMILLTGPTGCGKSTTLYTMINQINKPDVNILTVEDPIEYNLAGITQVQVHPAIGLTFETVLRAFLRQDPDIILVGEIRDTETAIIAVKAALTGHLVLSTLHTNDAPSTVIRLVDMGVDPYLVAAAVRLVAAQRLIRRLCPHCKQPGTLTEDDRARLSEEEIDTLKAFYRPKGCAECNQIGYRGRIAVFEVMPVATKEMKRAISDLASQAEIENLAKKEGMRNLRASAIALVNEGVTSPDEAFRLITAE